VRDAKGGLLKTVRVLVEHGLILRYTIKIRQRKSHTESGHGISKGEWRSWKSAVFCAMRVTRSFRQNTADSICFMDLEGCTHLVVGVSNVKQLMLYLVGSGEQLVVIHQEPKC